MFGKRMKKQGGMNFLSKSQLVASNSNLNMKNVILNFSMNMDPTVRFTFWDLTVGLTFFFTGLYLVNQSVSQRCLALPSLKKAKM